MELLWGSSPSDEYMQYTLPSRCVPSLGPYLSVMILSVRSWFLDSIKVGSQYSRIYGYKCKDI